MGNAHVQTSRGVRREHQAERSREEAGSSKKAQETDSFRNTLSEKRLHVRLCEDAATRGDRVDARVRSGQLVQP